MGAGSGSELGRLAGGRVVFKGGVPRREEELAGAASNGGTDSFQLQQSIRRAVGSGVGGRLRRRPMIIPIVIDA